MKKHHRMGAAAKVIVLTAFVAVAAGCATGGQSNPTTSIPVPKWLNTKNTVTALSDKHSQQIEQAGIGELVQLGASPWGADTQLRAGERYFSATGKTCFITTIESSSGNESATLCKYPEGHWGVTRSYTAEKRATDRQEIGGVQ